MLVNLTTGSTANGSSWLLVGRHYLVIEFSVEQKSSLDSHSNLCSKRSIMKLAYTTSDFHERLSNSQTDRQTDRQTHRGKKITTNCNYLLEDFILFWSYNTTATALLYQYLCCSFWLLKRQTSMSRTPKVHRFNSSWTSTWWWFICTVIQLQRCQWQGVLDEASGSQSCVRNGISAYCTIYSIGSSIAPDMSIKQKHANPFPTISTSGFLPNQCKCTSRISHCSVTLLFTNIDQHNRNTQFHSVIWYLGNTHSRSIPNLHHWKGLLLAVLIEYKLDRVSIRGSGVIGSQSPKNFTPDLVDPKFIRPWLSLDSNFY